ncbi:hypothetical protein ABCR94_24240 [Streptomyces sp. 21So2-11]|uniref:hypothetical protein n=1 Tax=Streptomyces sp. 21So2-11 TaxID=3144408 RepID=UPI00321ADD53
MSARRPLLTATAAGTLLCALWFVPSANATAEKEAQAQEARTQKAQAQAEQHSAAAAAPADSAAPTESDASDQGLRLADTGGVDTTPYLIGGTAFLGTGAAFVAFSMRRAARPV